MLYTSDALLPSFLRSSFSPGLFKLSSKEEDSCLGAVDAAGQPQWLEIASLD